MAQLVKFQHDLPTVKLNVALESPAASTPPVSVVLIEIGRGRTALAELSAPQEDLGVPGDFDPSAYRYFEPEFKASASLGSEIGRAATLMLGGDLVLWLQLAEPAGFLSVLPLEGMLRPFVGDRPIVRIPNFALFPTAPSEPINIAVCMSEPRAKSAFDGIGFLRQFIPSLLDADSRVLIVHLFTDATAYRAIAADQSFQHFTATARLVLHDPASAPPAARTATQSETSAAVTNPWLLWMLHELAGVTVDVVHFVTHGYTHSGQSALALAESPRTNEDTLWARFVGPNEVAAWLGHLGAWAVGFTSPPGNFSAMGLRAFYNDMARLRAGPVLHHDAGLDPISTDVAHAYSALLGGGEPGLLRSISMYAHPALFAGNLDVIGPESFADTLVSDSLGREASTTSAPAWVTSTSRYLEQSVATMFPEQDQPTSATQQAAGRGAERALRYVGEVLGRLGEPS